MIISLTTPFKYSLALALSPLNQANSLFSISYNVLAKSPLPVLADSIIVDL